MENPAERQSIYQELLTESFESLAKHFPKTHKATLQQCLGEFSFKNDDFLIVFIHYFFLILILVSSILIIYRASQRRS